MKQTWHEKYMDAMQPFDRFALRVNKIAFTTPSVIAHTAWFILWFLAKLDINLLTLIVSLEAIYITLFIGQATNRQEQRDEVQAQADKLHAEQADAHREGLALGQAKELELNTQLTREVHKLSTQIKEHIVNANRLGQSKSV